MHNTISPIDFRSELNEEQYRAVVSSSGPALVLAGAGSGKTRTLTYRVAYLLTQGVKPWEILLLTFTNKAAKEMLGRVEELTQVPQHNFWGGTFHSIGQRILRTHGKSVGLDNSFAIMDSNDSEALLTSVIQQNDSYYLKDKNNPKVSVLSNIISYSRNTSIPVQQVLKGQYPFLSDIGTKIDGFKNKYQERKLKEQVLDYDDLLELWHELLKKDEEVAHYYQNKFKHILVDEYQDTNKLQSSIIDLMSANHQIMAVGDDAQCIYTWRGADFENIANFPKRHPETVIHKIQTNYRSTPEILDFANQVPLYTKINTDFDKKLKSIRPHGKKPLVVSATDTYRQAEFIVNRIKGALQEGYKLSDIAILYRAHFHAMDLQMELSKNAIPYVITSGVRFFEQAHIRDIIAQIRFVNNSNDTIAFQRTACLLPKIGPKTAENLLKLANKEAIKNGQSVIAALTNTAVVDKVPEIARNDWTDMAITLQDVEECMKPPMSNVNEEEDLFTMAEKRDALPFIPKSPSEIFDIAVNGWYGDFLVKIHTNWSSRQDDLDSLIEFANRFDDMNELLSQLVLLSSETSDRSVDINQDNVRLTTIHQSKGLEYPIVFIIGLSDGLFPLKRAIEEGDIDEERRLFYVAATRAKDELYLTHPMISLQGGPPQQLEVSRFINEIPDDYYEQTKLKSYNRRPYNH